MNAATDQPMTTHRLAVHSADHVRYSRTSAGAPQLQIRAVDMHGHVWRVLLVGRHAKRGHEALQAALQAGSALFDAACKSIRPMLYLRQTYMWAQAKDIQVIEVTT